MKRTDFPLLRRFPPSWTVEDNRGLPGVLLNIDSAPAPVGVFLCRWQSGLFAQDGAGSRIDVMDLATYRTGHRLVDVMILHKIFGREALNALSG